MHQKINRIIWGIALILLIGLGISLLFRDQVSLYQETYPCFDTEIHVQIYEKDRQKVEKVFQKIDEIYDSYEKLTDTEQAYDDMVNLYTIATNEETKESLVLEDRLYRLLEEITKFSEEIDGRITFHHGSLHQGWDDVIEKKDGIPSAEEIARWNEEDQSEIHLLEDHRIENNHPHIYLGKIPIGFANDEIISYLEEEGIEHYLIQENGNATMGTSLEEEPYKVALEIPWEEEDSVTILSLKNKTVVTYGRDQDTYSYEGKTYHHLIDPSTSYPEEEMDKVTTIAEDPIQAYLLGYAFYLLPLETGQELAKDKGVDVLWYDYGEVRTMTEQFSSYVMKNV